MSKKLSISLIATLLSGCATIQSPPSTNAAVGGSVPTAALPAGFDQNAPPQPGIAHPAVWPAHHYPWHPSAEAKARIASLLAQMTIEEKIGQLVQADLCCVKPADIKKYHLGSILVGGNSGPDGDDFAAAPKWLQAADAFYAASIDKSDGGVGVPIIWGIDAVHGHSNIIGATLFPHNVGLGAMNDPELIERIGHGHRAGNPRHRAGMDIRTDGHRTAGLSLGAVL